MNRRLALLIVIMLLGCSAPSARSATPAAGRPATTVVNAGATATAYTAEVAKAEALWDHLTEWRQYPSICCPSWDSAITAAIVEGQTAVVKTTFTSGGDESVRNLCSAISGFIFANENRGLGLTRLEIRDAQGRRLMTRPSISDQCLVIRR